MKRQYYFFSFLTLFVCFQYISLIAQFDTLRIMTYNVLDFPLSSGGREVHFRTINQYLKADIILVNELSNSNGADILLYQALNVYGITYYAKADFVYGSNLNNLLYYNSNKLALYAQYEIQTDLRDINEYVLYYLSEDLSTTTDTVFLYFYVAHLKAEQGSETERLNEVNQFLSRLSAQQDAENVFFCGDLNLYTSSEPAYQALMNNSPIGFNDPLPAGYWHDSQTYSLYHTQSTRTDDFGGGVPGGLDDRFDFILYSDDVMNGDNKVEYLPASCTAFGNDGNHFNLALIDPPVNTGIPDSVINALYYMSDHLPVIADFRVEAAPDTTVAEIVITEIMYNSPESGTDSLEFIELYNNGSQPENLGGYYFSMGIDFTFPPVNLNPGEFLLVATNAVAMLNTFGVSCLQWNPGGLNNSGELILLKDAFGNTVDSVFYDDAAPWPTAPDGNGPSLILCDPNADNATGGNWNYSTNFIIINGDGSPIYATPGFTECEYPPIAFFTADATEIFVGETVGFTDLSSNNPTAWIWNFEGGTPAFSVVQNPSVVYNSPGIFDVSLTVSNIYGTDELVYADYITVTEESSGNLMITEIMQNPSVVPDENGEWFEVFNPTQFPIDMGGWYIKDNDFDSIKILGSLVVPPYGFAVLGANSNPATNGNYVCDYQYVYNDFQLGNSADEVILLNAGEEEIDRVEYDGGTNWPDPNGASMIFTGNQDEDNNDYNSWSVASIREPSYSGTSGDMGSPGTNGAGQNLVMPGFEVDLKVYIEGPFNGTFMNTGLTASSGFPMSQPYSIAPWNYNGSEYISSIPLNTIDWVLVEIRDAVSAENATTSTVLSKQAALLLSNGNVVGLDGFSLLQFEEMISQQLFAVIWHRNHLGIISHYPLSETSGIYTYDFTTQADQVLGNLSGYKEIAPGIFGMVGGDGNADGIIDLWDKATIWESQSGNAGYMTGDYNLDTQADNEDKNEIWFINTGKIDQIPD